MSGSQEENPLEAARQLLEQELDKVQRDKKSYPELAEREQRVASALAALDGGKPTKKRVQWESVADYLVEHPESRPGEIAAALEVPMQNVYAHLVRNEGTVFQRVGVGWAVIKGWEKHRRDGKDR